MESQEGGSSRITARPWTRWWWMGSAVTAAEITRHLEAYAAAGIGGVEITPIYGVKGREDQSLPMLSPEWWAMVRHAIAEGRRLGIRVDMTLGSGWPYGGPHVAPAHAPRMVAFHQEALEGGAHYSKTFGEERVETACLLRSDGVVQPVAVEQGSNAISCTAPAEGGALFVLLSKPTDQQVKRAAPGGAGNVMCPYSREAFDAFIAPYTALLAGSADRPCRVFYDSFEVFGADFAPGLLEQFRRRKGYCLRSRLPALAGHGDAELVSRVRCDYREVLGELLLEHGIGPWTAWASSFGIRSRYQAHGAPGNLLDLYAAADIPETEVFGTNRFPWLEVGGHPEAVPAEYVLVNKLASSAAHLTGKRLVSCETFTWLREHFCTSLADLKPEVDQLFLAGVNHIFFHGSTYSPADAQWPGWKFYASTHFDISDAIWRDLPEFNRYVTSCQEILQAGEVVNDLLVYFPYHDILSRAGDRLFMQLSVHGVKNWIGGMPWGKVAMGLWERGYAFDFVSDGLLAEARTGQYQGIVLPPCRHMPLATLQKLLELAEQGVRIYRAGDLPESQPGLAGRSGSEEYGRVREELARQCTSLEELRDVRPVVASRSLRAIRVRRNGRLHVFIANLSGKAVDGYVPLACGMPEDGWQMVEPVTKRSGRAVTREHEDGCEVYLQLKPGASVWLMPADVRHAETWPVLREVGEAVAVSGRWTVEAVEGGPVLPKPVVVERLASWTTFADPAWQNFSGTVRYAVRFVAPGVGDAWMLRFPEVGESVRVELNGAAAGTLWAHPFELPVTLRPGENELVCEVTNLSANRIAAMDRQGVPWRIFHEINFVNLHYKPFDASGWTPRPAGLIREPELRAMRRL